MSIPQPSQYQCDNMEDDDVLYVCTRSNLYKFIRDKFRKNLIKLRVRDKTTGEIKEYYQEDCYILSSKDILGIQKFTDTVPFSLYVCNGKYNIGTFLLKEVEVGTHNMQLIFRNGITIAFPISFIDNALKNQKEIYKTLDTRKLIAQRLKYQKYDGKIFREIVNKRKIHNWNIIYCSVCGEPVEYEFLDNKIVIHNFCSCGNITVDKKEISYDEFSVWYCTQTDEKMMKRNKNFWFDSEG